jgi:hypothetical protein
MPNVRGAPTRRFVCPDPLWSGILAYGNRHGIHGASAVIRLAVERLLAEDTQEDQ